MHISITYIPGHAMQTVLAYAGGIYMDTVVKLGYSCKTSILILNPIIRNVKCYFSLGMSSSVSIADVPPTASVNNLATDFPCISFSVGMFISSVYKSSMCAECQTPH